MSVVQEQIFLLQSASVPKNRETSLERSVRDLEHLLHESASRLVKELGGQLGSQTGPSDSRDSIMHNLKLAYNESLRYFYAFYQTRIVHFYLQA